MLVTGPILRHTDETTSCLWIETAEPCAVSVTAGDHRAETSTFTVHGRHFALAELTGLPPGSSLPYTVELDGERVWPGGGDGLPPSRIRTLDPAGRQRILFGSCRKSGSPGYGVDMLREYARTLMGEPEETWPSLLLLLGDQVYADNPAEGVRVFIRARRDVREPPGEEIADFTEYGELYRQAWSEPVIRWLLSTVPSAMIFDDHDLRDDWNTSYGWRADMARLPWWRRRVTAGLGAYWVYQHLGNLTPEERAKEPLLARLRAEPGDGGDVLDDFAARAYDHSESYRWSFARDLGGSRLIVLDSRCSRVLTPGRRSMLDETEWDWFEQRARGGVDHLVIGSSLPILLPRGIHHLENWNEAVCAGAWGRAAARAGEWLRRAVDLEHWAAFRESFVRLARRVTETAEGRHGPAPATVTLLSGDVHYSYLARVRSHPIQQLVCSPIHNPLPRLLRLANVVSSTGPASLIARLLAAAASVPRPPIRWRVRRGPWFGNMVATLDLDGRRARVRWHGVGRVSDRPRGAAERYERTSRGRGARARGPA